MGRCRERTKEERALSRFLIIRYREAAVIPSDKTRDALVEALGTAQQRIRGVLEASFDDPTLDVPVRRELLVAYSCLDRWMQLFEAAAAKAGIGWLGAAAGLIRRFESIYALAEANRPLPNGQKKRGQGTAADGSAGAAKVKRRGTVPAPHVDAEPPGRNTHREVAASDPGAPTTELDDQKTSKYRVSDPDDDGSLTADDRDTSSTKRVG